MPDLRGIEERIVRHGRVDSHDLEVLRTALYDGGKVDRKGSTGRRAQHGARRWEATGAPAGPGALPCSLAGARRRR
jgi:hypothetical protein